MGQIGEFVGRWPQEADGRADEKALEAVFDSMGRACVRHLVVVPHPFGLPARDRRVARRWLLRQAWVRWWKRDLVIMLTLVALGLAAALLILALHPSAEPVSDAVRIAAHS